MSFKVALRSSYNCSLVDTRYQCKTKQHYRSISPDLEYRTLIKSDLIYKVIGINFDYLVTLVVAGQVGQDTGSAGDDVHVGGRENLHQTLQQGFQALHLMRN